MATRIRSAASCERPLSKVEPLVLEIDGREQQPLAFPVGITTSRVTLPVGDYTATWAGERAPWVIERKALGDLFGSYASGYEKERAKFLKAADLGITFHLAIEASLTEVRRGHTYWAKGESHSPRKDGVAQVRQLMTITHRYGVPIHFFAGRLEMAWWVLEFAQGWVRSLEST